MTQSTEPLLEAPPATSAEGWCLVLSAGGAVMTVPLRRGRRIVVGRAPDVDVPLDDSAISRRHVEIDAPADGGDPRATDLGSYNGTTVADLPLVAHQPVTLADGDVIRLGRAFLLVQRAREGGTRAGPAGLHAGLRDLCASATRSFGYALVETDGGPPPEEVQTAIAALLRAGDVVTRASPELHEVMLPNAQRAQVAAACTRLREQLARLGIPARVGVACRPWDGTTWEVLASQAWAMLHGDGRPGVGDPMAPVRGLLERVAPSDISVLLLGETGVGKERCAEMLHRWSPRAEHPLLRLHCASLRDTLLESELFGHERGSFTGAIAAKPGLLETADGGTVFLDEIGDIPLEMQVKLLRVIEERAVLRIGALKPRRIDVRFVAATHRPLERDVAEGRFRQDLYFRLAGVQVEIPPLRDRPREIAGLARVFAVSAAQSAGRGWPPAFTEDALALLEQWTWPGNVRELRNTIERAVFLCNDGVIDVEQLVDLSPISVARRARLERTRPLKDEVADVEKEHILKVLDECGGNQTQAARRLGISRSTLNGRLDTYQVPRPRKRV